MTTVSDGGATGERSSDDTFITALVGPRKAKRLQAMAEESPAQRARLIEEGRRRVFAPFGALFAPPREPARRPADLYFIQVAEHDTTVGPVKIESAVDIARRIKTLQTASPYELELVGLLMEGASQERVLHQRFAHLHMRGEWFRPGRDLGDFIDSLGKPSQAYARWYESLPEEMRQGG